MQTKLQFGEIECERMSNTFDHGQTIKLMTESHCIKVEILPWR
jgi:hypothetical protein